MSQIDVSAGTLAEQLRDAFLADQDFSTNSTDLVKVFYQIGEHKPWIQYQGLMDGEVIEQFHPKVALTHLVTLWDQGYGVKVEVTVQLTGDWDKDEATEAEHPISG